MLFSQLMEKLVYGQELSAIEKQQMVLEARKMENLEAVFSNLLKGSATVYLSNAVFSGGDVVIDQGGIFIKNSTEAGLRFGNADNEDSPHISIYSSPSNSLTINNLEPGNDGIIFTIKMDDGDTPFIQFAEDDTEAGRTWTEIAGGDKGARLTLAGVSGGAEIELRTEGTAGGSTFLRMRETSNTPSVPIGDAAHMYVKGDKLIIQAWGAYFYLDLTASTNQSWIYSATAP